MGLKDETLDGIAPPLNFVKGKSTPSPCCFSSKIEGGEFQAANGGKPVCLDESAAGQIVAALVQ